MGDFDFDASDPEGMDGPSEASSEASPPAVQAPPWAIWSLTVLVVGVATWKVLFPAVEPPPPSPDEVLAAEAEAAWTRAPWTLIRSEDFSRLDRLLWSNVRERNPSSDMREYRGKLILHFSEQLKEEYPVIDEGVAVTTREIHRRELARSKKLRVHFKGHPPKTFAFPWIQARGKPRIMDWKAERSFATVNVRNPGIHGYRASLRAGYREKGTWTEGHSSQLEVVVAPGQAREFRVEYTELEGKEPAWPVLEGPVRSDPGAP